MRLRSGVFVILIVVMEENLNRSMTVWRVWSARMAGEDGEVQTQ